MSIKSKIIKYLQIVLFIIVTIGIFIFLRWLGLKGCLGIIIGMFIMASLLLSKNKYLKWVIDLTSSDTYIWDIMRK